MSKIYLNGSIIDNDKPIISHNERGFLLGDGLFETILAVSGDLYSYNQHVERLYNSAQLTGINLGIKADELLSICRDLLSINKLETSMASMRITVSRGNSQRGINIIPDAEPTIMITCAPYTPPDNAISCYISSQKRNEHCPLSNLKTLNYLPSVLARKEAQDNGFDEGILTNGKDNLVSTSIGNLFLVINDRVVTPPLSEGALNGITRSVIKNLCAELDMQYWERPIAVNDLSQASGAFHTNSLVGVQGIDRIGDVGFGSTVKLINELKNHTLKYYPLTSS